MRLSPFLLIVLGGLITTNDLALVALTVDDVPYNPAWLLCSTAVTTVYAAAVTISGRQQARARR